MRNKLKTEEHNAVHGIFAACLGISLYYIRNNWTCSGMIMGFFFELLYMIVFYMYLPFILSLVCFSIGGYVAELIRGKTQISAITIGLFAVAVLLACYIIFVMQAGILLILSGIFLAFRILLR